MAYDEVAESIALIKAGRCDVAVPPSRRRRWVPLGMDVQGPLAATCFVRRGIDGQPATDLWVLTRARGGWELIGGSLTNQDWTFLQARPHALSTGVLEVLQVGRHRHAPRRTPFTSRHGGAALLQTTTAVAVVTVGAHRYEVPEHGCVVVAWRGDSPRITALSEHGEALQTIRG